MTVHELLNAATNLSIQEQIHLASQLLELVDRQMEILADASGRKINGLRSEDGKDIRKGSIQDLMQHPLSVKNFQPLRRDEIYDS